MCFGGGSPAQPQVNIPANPVDQAYKDVVQTTEPDTSPKTPAATDQPPAVPKREQDTGITFARS